MSDLYDVAIVGAGLTGRLMAAALDHCGFSVALIDRAKEKAEVTDGRTTAIAFAGARLYQRLGLWEAVEPLAEPITDILVSNGEPSGRFEQGGLTGGQLHFPSSLLGGEEAPEGVAALGYIVENRDLLRTSLEHLKQGGVDLRFETSLDAYEASPQSGAGRLELSDGSNIETRLLVASDGRGSPLRAAQGLQVLNWRYRQTAITFNIAHELPHHGVAHEIFYPDGPFAILPMRDNHASIVWTEREGRAASFLAMSDDALIGAARERIGDHLGDFSLATKPQSFPLSFLYAPKLTAERFVLAGDAAHGIHPIAGQGFNLGIKDVAVLAHVLSEARDTGLDIGHGSVLQDYDRWRRFDSAALCFGTDALNRLFSNSFGPLQHLRGLGLGLVQQSNPVRRFFMRVSGADLGQLPALMQPL
jgi:2-octaprenyl-6-methoxyphenol hydroxylase